LLAGCAPKVAERPAEVGGPAWRALAALEPGENPLWFELGADGPALIGSPDEASLAPFVPWPLARYVAGMLFAEGEAALAVNREGFLVLRAAGGRLVLYRAGDARWEPHTVGAVFFYEGRPTAFLYRDDFFLEPAAPPPSPSVFALVEGEAAPRGVDVRALRLPDEGGSGGWENTALRRGRDGFWYFRQVRREGGRPETAYFRAGSLDEEGEGVSFGAWRDSGEPESLDAAPEPLARVLMAAFGLAGRGNAAAARALCPGEKAARVFAAPDFAGSGAGLVLSGFYREEGREALALLPDGRGFRAAGGGEPRPFSLPSLPEGFCYTAIAPAGDAFAAAWEEQEEAAVAAAGFMVVSPGE